jgi:hypothetical protein
MHATTHNSDPIFVAQVEALLQAANDHTAQGTLAYIEAGRMLRARKEHGKQRRHNSSRQGTLARTEFPR